MFKRLIASAVCFTFICSNLQYVRAQDFSINQLPVPGTMVGVSAPFSPLALKGLVINPQKPLEFQFLVDTGRGPQDTAIIKDQANQLVKYFLAGLTIPEGDLWVNLSPYEKKRMIPEVLGQTDLGRDLLAQDYILKQLTASLIYPEKDLGKEFWSRVYAKAQAQFGTTNVPVNTFNKVWILPDQAQVFENDHGAYVTKSTLKVMLEEDYLALQKQLLRTPSLTKEGIKGSSQDINRLGSQIIREIVLPEIEKEVNAGKNFAPLRQIYQALILAKWYKQTIQNSLLDAIYTNKNKIAGINLNDTDIKEKIYQRYLQAYKRGVFNYIKEDPTPNGEESPRKYFSGGEVMVINVDGHGTVNDVERSSLANGAMKTVTVALVADEVEAAGNNAMSSQMPQHLSEAELQILRGPDEANGFISKRPFNEDRVRKQILEIEKALGSDDDKARARADEAIALVKLKSSNFKNEEVHILNGTGSDAKVIGRVDRKIAEKFGYAHETANIVLLTPDGEVVLQMRNKDSYDDHLSMYGGHLEVGESHASGAAAETSQESGIDHFERPMIFMGFESYDKKGDNNRERRSWFVQVLTPEEWAKIKQKKIEEEKLAGADRNTDDRETFKFKLRTLWAQGKGEITEIYARTFDQIAAASEKLNPESKLDDKNNRYLSINDTFHGQTTATDAFFTPDSLDLLVKNALLWGKIRNLASTLSPTQKNYEGRYMYHAVPKAYLDQQRAGKIYTPERFWADGFIHFSADVPTALKMAARFYGKGTDEIVLLKVDAQQARNSGKLVIDDGKDSYPHLYGQMNLSAITREAILVRSLPGQLELSIADTNFAMINKPLEEITLKDIRKDMSDRIMQLVDTPEGSEPYFTTIRLLKDLKRAGIKIGIGTGAGNALPLLKAFGIRRDVDVLVDADIAAQEKLPGKASPEFFQAVAKKMKVSPGECAVIEDSPSNVEAAIKGGFGLAIGVIRGRHIAELRLMKQMGAKIVLTDIDDLSVSDIKKELPHLKGVIFDMGGVVMNSEPAFRKSVSNAIDDYLNLRSKVTRSFKGISEEELEKYSLLKSTKGLKAFFQSRGIAIKDDAMLQSSGEEQGLEIVSMESLQDAQDLKPEAAMLAEGHWVLTTLAAAAAASIVASPSIFVALFAYRFLAQKKLERDVNKALARAQTGDNNSLLWLKEASVKYYYDLAASGQIIDQNDVVSEPVSGAYKYRRYLTVKNALQKLGVNTSDSAMFSRDLGGIDLNNINIRRTGKIINVQFDPAQLVQLLQGGFQGFRPVIVDMTAITNPLALFGVGL